MTDLIVSFITDYVLTEFKNTKCTMYYKLLEAFFKVIINSEAVISGIYTSFENVFTLFADTDEHRQTDMRFRALTRFASSALIGVSEALRAFMINITPTNIQLQLHRRIRLLQKY